MKKKYLAALILSMISLPAIAQESTQPVTFDQVNAIARHLYCPACPNETLDTCQTQACVQWREDIRLQLTSGLSEQQIVDNFVSRYGDRVLGTPQDPALRALSLVTPLLVAGLALVLGVITFIRWRGRPRPEPVSAPPPSATTSDDYRQQIERDLRE